MWACPLCLQHNGFPSSYNGITPQRKPAELYPQCTTVEYVLRRPKAHAPFFVFVIDTCLSKDQLEKLKESILMLLDLLPRDSCIGLITFGTTVQMYELGYSECSKAFVFRGDKALSLEQFQEQIGISTKISQPKHSLNFIKSKFVVQLDESENEMNITSIIEEIRPDPWPVQSNSRDRRCTGVALSIATSLCETGFSNIGGHIMLFVGGPCTLGDGKVVELSKKEHIRLHNDIQTDNAPLFKSAVKFYQSLTQRIIKNGHVVDLFGANLDQIGATEMKTCIENSGGYLILCDSFTNPIYEESLKRIFELHPETNEILFGFNGSIEIQTSPTIKICGGLGPMTSMNQKSHCVSDTEVGYGNTNAWKMNCINKKTSISIFFDLTKQSQNVGAQNVRYFQFVTAYQHASGESRIRVTTTGLRSVQPKRTVEIAQGFDQEASAVIMSRLSVFKAQSEYLFDVLRWLDRSLIRLVRKFGDYQKDQPNSLRLSSQFSLFPQFMYHLRRGHFLRVFNNSPDETTYHRFYLNRDNTSNSLIMIQPLVVKYSYEKAPHSVKLDSDALQSNVILLMDSHDTILIYNGGQIAEWRDAGYQDQEKYKSFKDLLQLPKTDAKKIMDGRFPYPRYFECDEGSSQARIIYSKVNPSTTHKTPAYQGNVSYKILTDDSSLQFFMKHLKELVV